MHGNYVFVKLQSLEELHGPSPEKYLHLVYPNGPLQIHFS